MIPLELSLKNFFSYQKTSLDFRGLHVSCISGPNGAGKSSLLEAITWVLWGESRAKTKDDVILAGANDVRVDFKFNINNHTYRVIRTHARKQSGSLDFQVQVDSSEFRSLTGKGIKDTQELINQELKLDYDTFINSAYMRQGKVDEFMLKGPTERKEVLTKILKLDDYEILAENAQNQAKEYRLKLQNIDNRLSDIENELLANSSLKEQKNLIEEKILLTNQRKQIQKSELINIENQHNQYKFWKEQIGQKEEQLKNYTKEYEITNGEFKSIDNELNKIHNNISRESDIFASYNHYQKLLQEEEDLRIRYQSYSNKERLQKELENNINTELNSLNNEIFKLNTHYEQNQIQCSGFQKIIEESGVIEIGLKNLFEKRKYLKELDAIQIEISTLKAEKIKLESLVKQQEISILTELEQNQKIASKLNLEISARQEILNKLNKVDQQIDELDKKKLFLVNIEEKINDNKFKQNELEQKLIYLQEDLDEVVQKRNLLEDPQAICPICLSSLEEEHRIVVIAQFAKQEQEAKDEINFCHKTIKSYRQELVDLSNQANQLKGESLAQDNLRQKLSQYENKLDSIAEKEVDLKNEINPKIKELESLLKYKHYSSDLQNKLIEIEEKIILLGYSEQVHFSLRLEVEKLHIYEFRNTQLMNAKEQQANISKIQPAILEKIEQLQLDKNNLTKNSSLATQLKHLKQEIISLNYNFNYHQHVSSQLRQQAGIETEYQKLQNDKERLPELQIRKKAILQIIENKNNILQSQSKEIEDLKTKLENYKDYSQEIEIFTKDLDKLEIELDSLKHQQGRFEEQQERLSQILIEKEEKQGQKKELSHLIRVYDELSKAFGIKGIQSIMIENILPHLEQETNDILSRLTQNQLHVSFVTQKNASSGSRKKREIKTIDTLDILIADNNTTRPYEGYSGGEAFRINFSIRLALSRVLAQRAGTSLQLLIIDEGFGTQDAEGCQRLIGAINAIAEDFACILAVTHMAQFKEAFQQKIEVRKTIEGSQIYLYN